MYAPVSYCGLQITKIYCQQIREQKNLNKQIQVVLVICVYANLLIRNDKSGPK